LGFWGIVVYLILWVLMPLPPERRDNGESPLGTDGPD
jgi:phage shock protein PspC (stress-responsive transcriptional regulator)